MDTELQEYLAHAGPAIEACSSVRICTVVPVKPVNRGRRSDIQGALQDSFDFHVQGSGAGKYRGVLAVSLIKIKKASSASCPVESVEGMCHVSLQPPRNSQRATRWKWHDLVVPSKAGKGGRGGGSRSGERGGALSECADLSASAPIGLQLYIGVQVSPLDAQGGRVWGGGRQESEGEDEEVGRRENEETLGGERAREEREREELVKDLKFARQQVWHTVKRQAVMLQSNWRMHVARQRAAGTTFTGAVCVSALLLCVCPHTAMYLASS
jgi:hypothetical protein